MADDARLRETIAKRGRVEFFFEFASTYSHPAAMRIEAQAGDAIDVEWRPFLLGPIFRAQGWNDSPFNLYPARGRYMWRDLARICESQGIAWRQPSQFPRNGLLAARVACAAAFESDGRARTRAECWLPPFVRAVYRANFVHDRDIAEPDVVRGCLREAIDETAELAAQRPSGGPCASDAARCDTPEVIFARASAAIVKDALRAQTERAVAAGIFGAPSFLVGNELFWGNDRLDEALAFAVRVARA